MLYKRALLLKQHTATLLEEDPFPHFIASNLSFLSQLITNWPTFHLGHSDLKGLSN